MIGYATIGVTDMDRAVDRLQAAIAQRFGVGTSTVERLLKQWRTTGSLNPRKPPGAAPIVGADHLPMIEQWLKAENDLTQEELAQRYTDETGRAVSPRTMGRVRQRLDYTRKKRP